jgi:hypothetical protein
MFLYLFQYLIFLYLIKSGYISYTLAAKCAIGLIVGFHKELKQNYVITIY